MDQLFKNKGIRKTTFRSSVYQIVKRSTQAVGLDTIENQLGKHDRITLYRTIKTFVERGIFHEINLSGESTKYALCEDDCNDHNHVHQHQHIHFQCNNCHGVFCIPISKMPTFNIPGYTIEETEIQLKGRCECC